MAEDKNRLIGEIDVSGDKIAPILDIQGQVANTTGNTPVRPIAESDSKITPDNRQVSKITNDGRDNALPIVLKPQLSDFRESESRLGISIMRFREKQKALKKAS